MDEEPISEILMCKLVDIAAARQKLEYLTRLQEREEFEAAVVSAADRLVKARIEGFIGKADGRCIRAISSNLVLKLNSDPAVVGELIDLAWLPVAPESLQRRLDALDVGLQRYLASAVREEFPEHGTICITSGAN
jgi:hypothetical protein